MKDKDVPQMLDKNIGSLTDNELHDIALDPDTFKAMDAVVRDNPQFKDMTFIQLSESRAFQQALKEYKLNNQITASDPEKLKAIKKMSSTLGGNTALITDKDLKHALTPYQNSRAYIQQLDVDFFQQLEFDPENGAMSIKGNLMETITLTDVKTRSNLKELDLPLLRSLYTTIYTYADKIDTHTVTIYLPTLAKHLGINIRGDKPNDLFKKIMAFEHVIGVLDNGSFYRLLTFANYDKQTNSITFSSPYMNKILIALTGANTVTPPKGKPYLNPHHSFLIHGSIASERNKPAIEIVNAIVTLLHQRGIEKPPKTNLTASMLRKTVRKAVHDEFSGVEDSDSSEEEQTITTMRKKISAIIEEIPILAEALKIPVIDTTTKLSKPRTAKSQNKILERAFSGAYILLKTKTDVYKYFKNLQIPEIIPTVSTIDQIIEISHSGINEAYKKSQN